MKKCNRFVQAVKQSNEVVDPNYSFITDFPFKTLKNRTWKRLIRYADNGLDAISIPKEKL